MELAQQFQTMNDNVKKLADPENGIIARIRESIDKLAISELRTLHSHIEQLDIVLKCITGFVPLCHAICANSSH